MIYGKLWKRNVRAKLVQREGWWGVSFQVNTMSRGGGDETEWNVAADERMGGRRRGGMVGQLSLVLGKEARDEHEGPPSNVCLRCLQIKNPSHLPYLILIINVWQAVRLNPSYQMPLYLAFIYIEKTTKWYQPSSPPASIPFNQWECQSRNTLLLTGPAWERDPERVNVGYQSTAKQKTKR